MHIIRAAEAAIARFGEDAPAALLEMITAAVKFGDDDLVADFDKTLKEVEKRLGIEHEGRRP